MDNYASTVFNRVHTVGRRSQTVTGLYLMHFDSTNACGVSHG